MEFRSTGDIVKKAMHELPPFINHTGDNRATIDDRPRRKRVLENFQPINDIMEKVMHEFHAQQKEAENIQKHLLQKLDLEASSHTTLRGLVAMLEHQVQRLNESNTKLWEENEASRKEARKPELKERGCGETSVGASGRRAEETRDSETKEKKVVFGKEQ